MNVSMNGMLRIPQGEHNAWLFTLMYSPTSQLNFPIPGVAYSWNPSPQFHANIGLPLQMTCGRPTISSFRRPTCSSKRSTSRRISLHPLAERLCGLRHVERGVYAFGPPGNERPLFHLRRAGELGLQMMFARTGRPRYRAVMFSTAIYSRGRRSAPAAQPREHGPRAVRVVERRRAVLRVIPLLPIVPLLRGVPLLACPAVLFRKGYSASSSRSAGKLCSVGKPGCCWGASDRIDRALDHLQSVALSTSPRRTGLWCK